MTDISVILVDDSDADRYIARRVLNRTGGFSDFRESVSGDAFLEEVYSAPLPVKSETPPVLVLMDINMPGRNGFETIQAMQERIAEGDGPNDIVMVICSSSSYEKDKERAATLPLVDGYLTKPIDRSGIARLREIYEQRVA